MQIYKIYVNEKSLILHNSDDLKTINYPTKTSLILRFGDRQKIVFQCLDTLEKNSPYERVILHSPDFEAMKSAFKSIFVTIKAGGGMVMNEVNEGLFIHRRGFWDLPKGKLDEGESYKVAAVREVEEETGIQKLKQGKKLLRTRHVYKTKSGKRVLKITNWYAMTAMKQTLIPQATEQIEQAVWLPLAEFVSNCQPTFKSVLDVVNAQLSLKKTK